MASMQTWLKFKNIKFFCKNFIDIFLKNNHSIKKAKKYDLIFKLPISSLENCLSFVIFTNFYSIISIGKIQLDKSLYQTNSPKDSSIDGNKY